MQRRRPSTDRLSRARVAMSLAVALLAACLTTLSACGSSPQSGEGQVVAVAADGRELTVRRDDVPGVAAGVVLHLSSTPEQVASLTPGTRIVFTYTRRGSGSTLGGLRVREAAAPMHDHAPRHGGLVAMVGAVHLETLATADGRVRVWVTDFF